MKSNSFALFAAVAIFVGIGYLVLSGNKIIGNSDKIQIVAAENFYGNIAKQLGGDRVDVTSILDDPGTDPHLYESNALNAASVSSADIIIKNGLGYDEFMDKLLATSSNPDRSVVTVADVLQVNDQQANPHLWYDLPKISLIARSIEIALVSKDPDNTQLYQENLANFDSSLDSALRLISTIKTKYPNAPVAYTERVPGYLLADAGLNIKTPEGFAKAIEEGNEPNPNDTLAFERLINKHEIKVLFYNSQATSSASQHIKDLATQANIPVVALTETMPSDTNFQDWQTGQLSAIITALGK